MRKRKSKAQPDIDLKIQNTEEFSTVEREQIIEDLAELLISAFQKRHSSSPKKVILQEKEP